MVTVSGTASTTIPALSVLALSSRFDGRGLAGPFGPCTSGFQYSLCRVVLMVSHRTGHRSYKICFQYSLCRVVLMVRAPDQHQTSTYYFQYSLCRVVLMVKTALEIRRLLISLSVLALSSRFDGRLSENSPLVSPVPFSTRSVESF